jgi:hypothetical protein
MTLAVRRLAVIAAVVVVLAVATFTVSATTVTSAGAAGVPPDFSPEAVSAISQSQWWVFGTVPCKGPNCVDNAIVETQNAGRTFEQLPVPVAAAFTPWSFSQLAFTDSLHGYAYGPALYATVNGGLSWSTINLGGAVTSLAVGSRYVFALVQATCPGVSPQCPSSRLFRAPLGTRDWAPVASGFVSLGNTIATRGHTVIFNADEGTGPVSDFVYVSRNDGTSFAKARGPGLHCGFAFGSPSVIYAFCRSGMFYFLSRSENGGRSFDSTADIANGLDGCPDGTMSAESPSIVLGTCNGAGQGEPLLRSTNGGVSFRQVLRSKGHQQWSLAGSGPVVELFATDGTHLEWSKDAGATWTAVL